MNSSKQSLLIPRVPTPIAVTMIVVGGLLVVCAANIAMTYLGAPKLLLNPSVTSTKIVDTGPPFGMTIPPFAITMVFAIGWFGVWMILAGIYGSRKSSTVTMFEDTTNSKD